MDLAFKASQTNIRVSYTERGAVALRHTASVSLSLSLCLNIVAQRGRGGSGRGDVAEETGGGSPGEPS